MNARHARGFSLIELIAIIVLVSVAAVGILSVMGNVVTTFDDNQDIQTAAQLAQECSEFVMAFRRSSLPAQGYANIANGVNTGICNAFTGIAGFGTPPAVVNVTAHTSASLAACPATATECKQVVVTVSKGGTVQARTEFMLAN